MDLEAARKALPKRSTFSSKRVAFLVVVSLCLAAGVLLRSGQYFTQPEVEQNAPVAVTPSPTPATATPAVPQPQVEQNAPAAVAPPPPPAAATPAREAPGAVPHSSLPAHNAVTAPTEQAEPTGEAVDKSEPAGEADEHAESELPGSGIILVAKQPVEVRASPSSSAPALYGFPAGRPFRVIGREGGFAHIQDLKSSASGWIDEAALRAAAGAIRLRRAPAQPASRSEANNDAEGRCGHFRFRSSRSTGSQAPWLIWSRGSLRGDLRQRQLASKIRLLWSLAESRGHFSHRAAARFESTPT